MNVSDLSAAQLRQAATLKEQLETLHKELTSLLGAATPAPTAPAGRRKKHKLSAATRKKMADAHKARWAKIKGATPATPATTAKPAEAPKKKSTMSAAGRANIRAAQKARWAKVKAAKAGAKPAPVQAPAKKWKLSAAGKAKIIAATKARWAKIKAAKAK